MSEAVRQAQESRAARCVHCPFKREVTALAETLDQVPEAIALLDRSARVVRSNRAAAALFGAAVALRLSRDSRLRLGEPAARTVLAAALARCGRVEMAPTRIVLPRVGSRPLLLTLQALRGVDAGGAVAILFIGDPDAKPTELGAVLRFVYGLSPAETRLVQALIEGISLKEFASAQGLSYETIRSYTKRALAKTGARSQSDLIRLTRGLR